MEELHYQFYNKLYALIIFTDKEDTFLEKELRFQGKRPYTLCRRGFYYGIFDINLLKTDINNRVIKSMILLYQMKSEVCKSYIYEKKVYQLLGIDHCHFNIYANEHGGYALLLKNWVKEGYKNGIAAKDIAQRIKNVKGLKSMLFFF